MEDALEECDDEKRGSEHEMSIELAEVDSSNAKHKAGNDAAAYNKEYKECIEEFYKTDKNNKREKFVRCKLCISMPNIVKINSDNNKKAPLTTMDGSRYRYRYIADHFQTKYHKACKMSINAPTDTVSSIDFHVKKSDEQFVSHLKTVFCEIYVHAKKLVNSARSWPPTHVGSEAGRLLDISDMNAPTISSTMNLQYVNPTAFSRLLHTIVQSDKSNFEKKIETSIATSIRIDGSVDRTQVDKIYVMLKLITQSGEKELVFLGIGEQTARGAVGLFEAVKRAIIDNHGEEIYKCIMKKNTSICTDGTNVNIGERGGLWTHFENEMREIGSVSPFTKVWCSAHRMELVWNDVCQSHAIINKVLNQISSMSSYFHKSGLKTSELRDIAKERNLDFLLIPKLFTIRWTEYSFTIVDNFLTSWEVFMIYFDSHKDTDPIAMGYLNFFSKIENLRVIAFLADLLQIFSRYHKKIQSDNATIVSLVQHLRSLQNALVSLKGQCLIGGREETLKNEIQEEEEEGEDKLKLKGFELLNISERRKGNKTDFKNIRDGIIDTIVKGLSERFSTDHDLMKTIEPFLNFNKDADLRKVHELFGSDLPLPSIQLQFIELIDQGISAKFGGNIDDIMKALSRNNNYKEIMTIIGRIHVLTPHSADVERCISANNLLKTPWRNRIKTITECAYLYIHFNMPCLENWDPRQAIKLWMTEKDRRDVSNVIERKSKKSASYFKGIFADAAEAAEESDEFEI